MICRICDEREKISCLFYREILNDYKIIKYFLVCLAFAYVMIDYIKEKHETAHFCPRAYLMEFNYERNKYKHCYSRKKKE